MGATWLERLPGDVGPLALLFEAVLEELKAKRTRESARERMLIAGLLSRASGLFAKKDAAARTRSLSVTSYPA